MLTMSVQDVEKRTGLSLFPDKHCNTGSYDVSDWFLANDSDPKDGKGVDTPADLKRKKDLANGIAMPDNEMDDEDSEASKAERKKSKEERSRK